MKKILNIIKNLSNNEIVQKLLIETIGKISLKQDNIELFIKENNEKIIHIRDWITSVIENGEEWKTPRVLTLEALNNTANKYFNKKNNKIQTIELDETHEKLIANLGDYYIVKMLTPEALDNESKVMQHCIGYGSYDKNLNNKDYLYLSLRDKFNKAHVTLEIKNNNILQLQGKQDRIPEDRYLEKILPWLIKKEFKSIPWSRLGRYYKNGHFIKIEDIILIENIDYKLEIINSNLQIKHPLSIEFDIHYNNIDKKDKLYNDCVFIKNTDKQINSMYILKNHDENKLYFVLEYLVSNDYKNIPWNSIQKYPENGKLIKFEEINIKESIDYKLEIINSNVQIKHPLNNKFYIHNKHYNNAENFMIINDSVDVTFNQEKQISRLQIKDHNCIFNINDIDEINIKKQKNIYFALEYLLTHNYKNIPWKGIGKYIENGKFINLKDIKVNENIDFIVKNKLGEIKIYEELTDKFKLFREYSDNFDKDNYFIISENKIIETEFHDYSNKNINMQLVQYFGDIGCKNIPYGYFKHIYNQNDNQIYSIYNFPEKCKIEGNLNLSHTNIKTLPDNLIINGDLILNDCNYIKKMPNNIQINGLFETNNKLLI